MVDRKFTQGEIDEAAENMIFTAEGVPARRENETATEAARRERGEALAARGWRQAEPEPEPPVAPAAHRGAQVVTAGEQQAADADQVARLRRMAPVHLGRAPERVTRLSVGTPVEVLARQPDFEEVQAPGQPFPTRVWREAAVAHKLRPG